MHGLVLRVTLLFALVSAAAGAGEVQVGIVPPDGWTRVDAKGTNLLAAWRDPSAKVLYQNLTLAHDDTAQSLVSYALVSAKALRSSLPGSTPTSSALTICRNRPAYALVAVGRYGGVRVRIEELVTDIGGKKFIGTYTRPAAAPSAAAAEAALRTICPRL